MKRALFLTLLCLSSHDAFAQSRMRDYSLSPEESAKQPDVVKPHDYLNPNAKTWDQLPTVTDGQSLTYTLEDNSVSQRPAIFFMDRFCDPGFQPGIANPKIQSCVDATRQKSCATFQRLPQDAQRVLDHSISCAYAKTDTTGDWATDPSCEGDAEHQLSLLRKYWREPSTAEAIVFLPDQVLNAASFCVTKGGPQ